MGRRGSVRGEGSRRPPARDLGWDDSLYEDRRGRMAAPPRQRGFVQNDDEDYYDDDYEYDDYEEPPRRKRRVLRWFVGILAFAILATAGGGYLYYRHLNGNIGKDDLNLGTGKQVDKKPPNAAGQTELNILLLGSDSRADEANQKLGGARDTKGQKPRADVQMLLHVSADRSNMNVVTIPRDTKVNIPECKDSDGTVYPKMYERINASLGNGGPGCTVATWSQLTGVHIDHFMMVDFAGVVSMADAVGGVPVCVDKPAYDKKSGLKLPEGTTEVKGEQALQWLRTRYIWGSDLGRAKAQHQYMNAMVRELKAGSKLTDPGQLMDLAEAATKALTVDKPLADVRKLYNLSKELKKVPAKRITMTTMPVLEDPDNPQATLVPNKPEAEKLWKLLRDDAAFDGGDAKKKKKKPESREPTLPKAEIPVVIQNGTGTATVTPVTGRAAVISEALNGLGYDQAAAENTPKSQADTTIRYGAKEDRPNALAVAKSLGLPDRAVKDSSEVEEITLVIGADWRDGNTYPKELAEKAAEEKAPDSAEPLNGGNDKACMKVYPYQF